MHRSLSPSTHHHYQHSSSSSALPNFQIGGIGTGISSNGAIQNNFVHPNAPDEILKLRKDLRAKEAEFSKEKAVLTQKVQLLELQLKEYDEREEKQRKLHDTMINCLNSGNDNSQSSNYQLKIATHDIQELRDQKKQMGEEHEFKEKELKRQVIDKDLMIKELHLQLERNMSERRQQQSQLEQERKEFQSKTQMLSIEKNQLTDRLQQATFSKNTELSQELDKVKQEHSREVEKMKNEYEQSLKDIKYFHDQEKSSLEVRVERSSSELKSLMSLVKSRDNQMMFEQDNQQEVLNRRREDMEKEVELLQDEVEKMRKDWSDKIELLRSEKDASDKKVLKLKQQLDKIKNAPRPVKIDLADIVQKDQQQQPQNMQRQLSNQKDEIEQLQQENNKLSENVKKLRKELLENTEYTEQVEQNERKLRNMLKQRDSNVDSDKNQMKKQLNIERKKVIDIEQKQKEYETEMELMKNKHVTDMLDKDDKIIKMTKETRDLEKKIKEQTQALLQINASNNGSTQRSMSPFSVQNNCDSNGNHNRCVSYSPINLNYGQSNANLQQQNFMFPTGQTQSSIISYQNSQTSGQMSPTRNGMAYCVPLQSEHQSMKMISQLELTLLRTCQRMADSAIRMECSHCFNMLDTSDFYDHLIAEHTQLGNIGPKSSSQSLCHQSQLSINNGGYSSNKANNAGAAQNLTKRNFAEDKTIILQPAIGSGIIQQSQNQSMSPRSNLCYQGSRNFQVNPLKISQNSKSFTWLLKEIEEEEKHGKNMIGIDGMTTSSINSLMGNMGNARTTYNHGHNTSRSPIFTKKAPHVTSNERKNSQIISQQIEASSKDQKRAKKHHNATTVIFNKDTDWGNTQMSKAAKPTGNTIQSVLRNQKMSSKKGDTNKSSQRDSSNNNNITQNISVMTACRTEIQNLKRQNKKISTQLHDQESKLQDVSKECSALKKKTKVASDKNSSKVTTEIKDLLQKLVTYQGVGQQKGANGGGSVTQRNVPSNYCGSLMSDGEDSLVQLKSINSIQHQHMNSNSNLTLSSMNSEIVMNGGGGGTQRGQDNKKNKSPISMVYMNEEQQIKQHNSNKENNNGYNDHQKVVKREMINMPKVQSYNSYNRQ